MTLYVSGFKISYPNFREFISIYKDIFILNEYRFKSSTPNPFIIDCGSHIGISVLYFKKLYPNSHILSFEPNPNTFKFLEKNTYQNNIKNIHLINTAVGKKNGKINFYSGNDNFGWAWGDSAVKNSWYNSKNYKTIKVDSKKLSNFIDKKVDLLKIDIEGLEVEVLNEIENKLSFIQQIYIEFHGNNLNKDNSLSKLTAILNRNGFKYSLRHPYTLFHPFNASINLDKINTSEPYFLIVKARKKD